MQKDTITWDYDNLNKADNFIKLIEKEMIDRPGLLKYIEDLDAYSPETFNHSVNVAAIVHNELSKNSDFSQEEVKKYTIAALVHDVGKLTTPLEYLHSSKNYRLEEKNINNDPNLTTIEKEEKKTLLKQEKDCFLLHMDMHSINGYTKADEYGLTETEKMIGLSHHMGARAIEYDIDNNDTNYCKSISKSTWKNNIETIQDFAKSAFANLVEKDFIAIDIVSLADITEALVSERSYKKSMPWNKEHMIELQNKIGQSKINNNSNEMTVIDVLYGYCQKNNKTQISFFGHYAENIVYNLINNLKNLKEIVNVSDRDTFSNDVSTIEQIDLPCLLRSTIKFLDSNYEKNKQLSKCHQPEFSVYEI